MRFILSVALSAAMLAAPVYAVGPVAFGPSLSGQGWTDMPLRGHKPVEFSAQNAGTLRIQSDSGVSLIWRTLPREFSAGEKAQWRWRVDTPVPPTDLTVRRKDDRDIALYFLFSSDPDAADNPPKSLKSAMLSGGRALIYVWGGDAPQGSILRNPSMLGRGQMVIRRPSGSSTGKWENESVDLRADFRKAFGREPGPLVGIAVSADSDNTSSLGDAQLGDLVIR